MISPAEEDFIRAHAFIPEQVVPYATVASGLEPFLADRYLYFFREGRPLVFIGYPLAGEPDLAEFEDSLKGVVRSRGPAEVAILAPSLPPAYGTPSEKDHYYLLETANFPVPPKVANMIRRASRGLSVTRQRALGPEHLEIIRGFYESRPIGPDSRAIFQRIPAYVEASPTAVVFSASTGDGRLAAFDIAEFWANHYAFYMFNFRSSSNPFPGASDLLLREIVVEAKARGKSRINLGLGINAGVTFFKTKWGARSFLPHQSVLYRGRPPSFLETLLRGFR